MNNHNERIIPVITQKNKGGKVLSKLRALWRNGRGLLFVVLVGIAFYEMLEHFSSVRAVISRTTSVLMPILCGLMVAYIINIPATILQGTLFKKAHAAGKKYVVPLTVVLSYRVRHSHRRACYCYSEGGGQRENPV